MLDEQQTMQQDLRHNLNSERAEMLAKAAVGLSTFFVACCLVIHFVQPDLNPVEDAVSYYMNGRLGWIVGLGLVALGVGSLFLAGSLYALIGPLRARSGLSFLSLWGAGVVICGIFPPDPRGHWDSQPSLPGMIHASVSMVALLAFPTASLLLSRRLTALSRTFGTTRHLRWLAVLCTASLAVFFVCLAPVFSHHPPYALGLSERVLIVLFVAWLVAVGVSVRRAAERTKPVGQTPIP